MNYLSVVNWDKFQHYKQRNPPWIKLHNDILHHYEYACLQDASKLLLIHIWLLASKTDNKIPNDPTWLQKTLGLDTTPDVNILIDSGFLEYASNMLADCVQSATHCALSDRGETEAEQRQSRADTMSASQAKPTRLKPVPYSKIIDLYHERLPMLPKVARLNTSRKTKIRQMWKENEMNDLDVWRDYFDYVAKSKFLTGKVHPPNGRKVFMADIDWLINSNNAIKIEEGKYHG